MDLITWNEKLSVNVKEFDGQHQRLIAMINEMHDAMKAGRGRDAVGAIITKLVEYVKTHFAAEEKFMEMHAYPGYISHKAQHDTLTKQVTDYANRLGDGRSTAAVELMTFLKSWLTDHIVGSDKKYGPYLNSKGVR